MQISLLQGFVRPFATNFQLPDRHYVAELVLGRVLILDESNKVLGAIEGLKGPHAVLVHDGFIYITEYFGRSIKQFQTDGRFVKTVLSADSYSSNAPWILAGPMETRVHPKESQLIVCDFNSNSLQRFSFAGEFLGYLGRGSSPVDDHPWRLNLQQPPQRSFELDGFDRPHGIRFDSEMNLYIVDAFNHRIVKAGPEGHILGWLGGCRTSTSNEMAQHSGFDSSGESSPGFHPAQFSFPISLALDSTHFYVLEQGNCRLQRFTLDGQFSGWLGGQDWSSGSAEWKSNGLCFPGRAAGMFHRPYGLEVVNKQIIVADTDNNRLQILHDSSLV